LAIKPGFHSWYNLLCINELYIYGITTHTLK
jgi:hypothetical protein